MRRHLSALVLLTGLLVTSACDGADAEGSTSGSTTDASTTAGPGSTTNSGDATTAGPEGTTSDGESSTGSESSSSTSGSESSTGSSSGEDASTSTGEPGVAPTCPAIVGAWNDCDIQGPYEVDGCQQHVDTHPAITADCSDAILARMGCYASQGCTTLEECSLWGCLGEEACEDEAAAVEEACERTLCEKFWDDRITCGSPQGKTWPGFCEYIKALDAFLATDAEACRVAYDARLECLGSMECDVLEVCVPTQDDPCIVDGVEYCADEQTNYELACD